MQRKQIERGRVLEAAAEVVRKKGAEGLTARELAGELKTSTQPIYSLFGNMENLRAELKEEAKAQYHVRIEGYMQTSEHGKYAAFGMGFVRFAREERGLFRLLFLSEEGAPDDPFLTEILAEMERLYQMPREKAVLFHRDMTLFSYGLALAVYGGGYSTDGEIAESFDRAFYALYSYYFPERPRFWEKRSAEDKP